MRPWPGKLADLVGGKSATIPHDLPAIVGHLSSIIGVHFLAPYLGKECPNVGTFLVEPKAAWKWIRK